MESRMMLRLSSLLGASPALLAGLLSGACECIDCNRTGPTIGYVRVLVQEEGAGAVAGASVHIDNRIYVTESMVTNSDGLAVLLVYMDPEPTDTGTVTVQPPTGYQTPSPQAVIIPAADTVSISFSLAPL
jgi:hypothetical protein